MSFFYNISPQVAEEICTWREPPGLEDNVVIWFQYSITIPGINKTKQYINMKSAKTANKTNRAHNFSITKRKRMPKLIYKQKNETNSKREVQRAKERRLKRLRWKNIQGHRRHRQIIEKICPPPTPDWLSQPANIYWAAIPQGWELLPRMLIEEYIPLPSPFQELGSSVQKSLKFADMEITNSSCG